MLNAMEGFHTDHLSDEQMKALNPIIRLILVQEKDVSNCKDLSPNSPTNQIFCYTVLIPSNKEKRMMIDPRLDAGKLPTLQPVIRELVRSAIPQFRDFCDAKVGHIAELISQYVASSATVDTQTMTRFFETMIPKEALAVLIERVSAVTLKKGSSGERKLPVGTIRIKDSPERRLLSLAIAFLAYRYGFNYSGPDWLFSDFVKRISGISIVNISNPVTDPRRCDSFVFDHLAWYNEASAKLLFESPQLVVDFLLQKGFTRVAKVRDVQPGQVAIYHDGRRAHHFAKITKVDEKGVITVISKLGRYHVCEHRLGLTPEEWGGYAIFVGYPETAPLSEGFTPLLPLILREIMTAAPQFDGGLAHCISEYVTSESTIETQRMTAFFYRAIPKECFQMDGAVTAILDGISAGNPELPQGAIRIKDSSERRLINLAASYFAFRSAQSDNDDLLDGQEFYDFIGRVSGITVVEACTPLTDARQCHHFVFGQFDWCIPKSESSKLILEKPKIVIDFLITKGFSIVKKLKDVRAKQIVVYYTANMVYHFARVEHVNGEGVISAISKLARYHIVEHPIGSVPQQWGGYVTFLNVPQYKSPRAP